MVTVGADNTARAVAAGLLNCSADFDARLPELFADHGAEASTRPAPYPASCRPQAWAAAASVAHASLTQATPDESSEAGPRTNWDHG